MRLLGIMEGGGGSSVGDGWGVEGCGVGRRNVGGRGVEFCGVEGRFLLVPLLELVCSSFCLAVSLPCVVPAANISQFSLAQLLLFTAG